MAGITFSEVEVKRLILALAGSKAMPEPEDRDEPEDKEEPEDKPVEKADDKSDEGEGKPFGKGGEESTKDMLARKLREKGSK